MDDSFRSTRRQTMTPGKPKQSRISLSGVASHYFSASRQSDANNESFVSIASASDSSASDVLNQSTLSDTTELTASNFVKTTTARQLLILSKETEEKPKETFEKPKLKENVTLTVSPKKELSPKRPPLGTVNGDKVIVAHMHQRRMSLPLAQSSNVTEKRLSWQPKNDTATPLTVDVLKQITKGFKEQRLQRQSIGSRRSSIGMDLSKVDVSRTSDESNVSQSALDDLFDGLLETTPKSHNLSTRQSLSDLTQGPDTPGAVDSQPSPASTLSSSGQVADFKQVASSPRPLPEQIAFTKDESTQDSTVKPVDSPARNTRSAKKQSPAAKPMDSPARNTRSANKLAQSPSATPKPVDSPARNTRSGKKSIQSPAKQDVKLVNSPARNTRSAAQKLTHSPATQTLKTVDSPARNTRSAKKQIESSPLKSTIREASPAKETRTINKTMDSPAHNTLSAKQLAESIPKGSSSANNESQDMIVSSPLQGSLMKSKLDWDSIADTSLPLDAAGKRKRRESSLNPVREHEVSVDMDTSVSFQKRRKSSISSVASVLRKPGSAIKKKSVVFGSPEVAEYNVSSPSMSMTPLPANRAKEMYSMPSSAEGNKEVFPMTEDTREIEADMAALLQNVDQNQSFEPISTDAGSTPFKKRPELLSESTVELEESMGQILNEEDDDTIGGDDSNDDMDVEVTETVQLEGNMMAVIQAAATGNSTVGVLSSDDDDSDEVLEHLDVPEEENTVELEIDMAALVTVAAGSTSASKDTEEAEATQPLESTMQSLLKEESGTDITEDKTVPLEPTMLNLLEGEDTPPPMTQRRRSSFGSRRFSLAPSSRLSITSDGDSIVVDDLEEEVTDEVVVEKVLTPKKLTLTNNELLKFISPRVKLENADLLTTLSEVCCDVPCGLLVGMMGAIFPQVIDEVKNEMEPQVVDDKIVQVSPAVQQNAIELQEVLRSGMDSQIESKLQGLAVSSKRAENYEWTKWMNSVVGAVQDHIEGFEEEIGKAMDDLLQQSMEADQLQTQVDALAESAVKRARRKSFNERQAQSQLLEQEIADLTSQVTRAKAALDKDKAHEQVLSQKIDLVESQRTTKEKSISVEDVAEKLECRFIILRGLQKWRPVVAEESLLQIALIGPCPKACIRLSFILGGKVHCQAQVDPTLFCRRGNFLNQKHIGVLLPLIESRTEHLCGMISSTVLDSPKQIKVFLRHVALIVNRLDRTVTELCALRRRYNAVIERIPGSSDFQVEIDFVDSSGDAKLRGTFELGTSYPFAPVAVQFDILQEDDKNTNMDDIRRKVIKNAKPGFGYLSRTVDVVLACLQR